MVQLRGLFINMESRKWCNAQSSMLSSATVAQLWTNGQAVQFSAMKTAVRSTASRSQDVLGYAAGEARECRKSVAERRSATCWRCTSSRKSRIPGGCQSNRRVSPATLNPARPVVATSEADADGAITRTWEFCLRCVKLQLIRLDACWNNAEHGETRLRIWSARHQYRGGAAVHGARLLDQPEQVQCALCTLDA